MAACTLSDYQQPLLVNQPPVDNDGQLTYDSSNKITGQNSARSTEPLIVLDFVRISMLYISTLEA